MCALFGSPINPTDVCDFEYSNYYPASNTIQPTQFTLSPVDFSNKYLYTFYSAPEIMDVYHPCDVLKGRIAPEYSMLPPEKESEITIFYDHITVKETPSATKYQIYTVTGQLIQTGTTNPDISTVQLTKGMYILRLENGRAFKFIK
jgi:hypothetical protein